jgi:hypothetical protein
MREYEFDLFELGDLASEVEFFSGGGQGGAPKPPTKIQGSQHIQRQEKIRNIPKPMPRPPQRPK